MRWSYSDLLAMRLLGWLRRAKADSEIRATPMAKIRDALGNVESLGAHLADDHVQVKVDLDGQLIVRVGEEVFVPVGRKIAQLLASTEGIDLIAPFEFSGGEQAPDLARPRPTLRIIPGMLAGEPHVSETRISTMSIAALDERGLPVDQILRLYPDISTANVEEAISLERQIKRAA